MTAYATQVLMGYQHTIGASYEQAIIAYAPRRVCDGFSGGAERSGGAMQATERRPWRCGGGGHVVAMVAAVLATGVAMAAA